MDESGQYVPPKGGMPDSAPGHDEIAEVLEILRTWPHEYVLTVIEELGLTIGGDTGSIGKAVDAARIEGKAEGQRELLQRLFRNVRTGGELIERAATMAFAEVWPDETPCPLTASDFASLAGMSERTAARRASESKLAGSFADKQRAKCASMADRP
jgi:hypothetical protein